METIHTRIWQEEAEPDNAFAAASCHCHGYDVYGDLLKHASWIEYLFLLFRGEAPTPGQARLLEGLAIALANPGPRDAAVHAAMCGGVGGSTVFDEFADCRVLTGLLEIHAADAVLCDYCDTSPFNSSQVSFALNSSTVCQSLCP